MLTMLDISVLFLALPSLSADLGASASEQLWISDIYGFLIAGFLVTMGTLGDRIGRRRVLLFGAAAFGLASILAAYSTSPEMLIAARALLGIAGATIMPSTLALIFTMFPNPKQMGVAFSVWAGAMTAGVALGPVVGGVLLESFWWGSVFLIGVPVMLLLLVTGPFLLPNTKEASPGRLDPVSVILVLAAILPFIYGFKELARIGWDTLSFVAIIVGVVFGIVFVLRQRRLENPLLDVRLFAIKAVSGALLLSFLIAAVQGGAGLFIALQLQLVEGFSPMNAGLWLLVPTVVLLAGIFISSAVAKKIRPAYVLAAGTLISAIGMFVLTQVTATTGVALLIVGFTIVYLGVSPVGPLVSQMVVPAAPEDKAGSASSLSSTGGELGVALGVAAIGSIGTAVYRSEVTVPAEIAGTADGATAGESLAGALEVAKNLSTSVADSLITSGKEAFTSGLNIVAVVCTVAFVGLAGVAIATLRHVPPMSGDHGHGDEEAPEAVAEEERAPLASA